MYSSFLILPLISDGEGGVDSLFSTAIIIFVINIIFFTSQWFEHSSGHAVATDYLIWFFSATCLLLCIYSLIIRLQIGKLSILAFMAELLIEKLAVFEKNELIAIEKQMDDGRTVLVNLIQIPVQVALNVADINHKTYSQLTYEQKFLVQWFISVNVYSCFWFFSFRDCFSFGFKKNYRAKMSVLENSNKVINISKKSIIRHAKRSRYKSQI